MSDGLVQSQNTVGFMGNTRRRIQDRRKEHVEIIDSRYRVTHDSTIEHVEFTGDRYRVIQEPRIQHVEIIDSRY
jgi:hypothetical protein